jgi:hypothetical protein
MPFIIYGKTKCPICGEAIMKGDEIVALPAFVGREHKLYLFSDAATHRRCFDAHPLKFELRDTFRKYANPQDPLWGQILLYLNELVPDEIMKMSNLIS